MKVVFSHWFTNRHGVIGLVVCEDEITHERTGYISSVLGFNEDADIEVVKTCGSKVRLALIKDIVKELEPTAEVSFKEGKREVIRQLIVHKNYKIMVKLVRGGYRNMTYDPDYELLLKDLKID